ncbi:hypothetical protein F4818DRAFT_360149 [Hypoxylon cercidicola]|nr:hypothetical protein F4818DRAFT_360149 [Hypoxylon cercidicola]
MGLDPSNGPAVNVLLLTYCTEKRDDERVTGFMQRALKRIEQNADARGQLVPHMYWNYAFSDQDALRFYREGNIHKLQEASKKYDRNGMFQAACPDDFKLGGIQADTFVIIRRCKRPLLSYARTVESSRDSCWNT